MTKTELQKIRSNKFKNSDLKLAIEATAAINKIEPTVIKTTDGQTLEGTKISLRIASGYLEWKIVNSTEDVIFLKVNDVLHFYAIGNISFFISNSKRINKFTISKMVEWEIIGELDAEYAKAIEIEEVDLAKKIKQIKKQPAIKRKVGLK